MEALDAMSSSGQEIQGKGKARISRWMLVCAALPLIGFIVLSLLGGKESIQVLTGTQALSFYQMAVGGLYLASYMALVLLSPVFLLATIITFLWNVLRQRAE